MQNIKWLAKKDVNRERVEQLLTDSLTQNQFTNGGPNVKRLEKVARDILHINDDKGVIVVNNGCSALHALVSALIWHANKPLKFATQSYTFPVSVQGTLKDSIIVDIDQDGGPDLSQINVNEVDGLIVTNVLGHVTNLNKYLKWADDNHKILLLDNAATSLTWYNNTNSVNLGLGAIVSFHHTKPIGFGEGGLIVVDKKYEPIIRKVINFGYDMLRLDQLWHPEGSNYKMSDVSAIYILQYLDNLPTIVGQHQRLYAYFLNKLKTIPNVQPFPNFSDNTPVVSSMPVIFNKPITVDEFTKLGIEAKKYYKPLRLDGYSLDLYQRIICFPCNVDMTISDVDYILTAVKNLA